MWWISIHPRKMNRTESRQEHAKQFLAGLILVGLAGTATLWHFTGFYLAMAYFAGFSTPIVFAKVAPSYSPPDTDSEQEEADRGYR
jgi:hypothetical protein